MDDSTRPSTPNTVIYDDELSWQKQKMYGAGTKPRPPSGNSLAPPAPSSYKSPGPGSSIISQCYFSWYFMSPGVGTIK